MSNAEDAEIVVGEPVDKTTILKDPTLAKLAIAIVVVWGLTTLFLFARTNPEPQVAPWGEYLTRIYTGDINDDGTITRYVNDAGHPIVNETNPQFHTVRCGPAQPVDIVSSRFYIIGELNQVELRITGSQAPFTFPPLDTESGCDIISFSSTSIPPLELIEDGQPFLIRLDLEETSGRYLGVTVRTERMVFGDPNDGTLDAVTIEAP